VRHTEKYAAVTKDEAERSPSALLMAVSMSNGRWTFYEAVKIRFYFISICGIRSSNLKAKPSMGPGPEGMDLVKARSNYQPYHFGYER